MKYAWVLFGIIASAGCSAKPVLYPNAHLNQVGGDQTKRDVAECRRLADEYVSSHRAREVAGRTVEEGAVGGAMGAAGGAVVHQAAAGAEVGAAAGAAGGLVRGIFHSSQPNHVYKNFVDHCLKDRGYDVIGWQ